MKIAVVGTGYVGLVTGTCFAETGNHVTCVDINEDKINRMKAGEVPIYEPGLEDLFHRNTVEGRLNFTTSLSEGIEGAKVIFLALPTPPGENGSADLKYILQVAKDLGPLITEYTVIIDKSTVPVGTSELVHQAIAKNVSSDLFDVVSNPEFLREGVAVEDFMKPDRVVIGTESDKAKEILNRLYAPLVRQGNPIIFMDERSAEMTKYAANAFLATKISYINAVAAICEGVGADINDVVLGLGYDKRIGHEFLRPGPGWGGSCFPKDTKAMVKIAQDAGYDFGLLKGVITVNDQQYGRIVDKIRTAAGGSLKGKKIASWGLTFKALTDDLRDSPAVEIIKRLLADGASVTVFDPTVTVAPNGLDAITVSISPLEACVGADVIAVLTEWDNFRWVSPVEVAGVVSEKQIVDARNLLDRSEWQRAGFEYQGIGR